MGNSAPTALSCPIRSIVDISLTNSPLSILVNSGGHNDGNGTFIPAAMRKASIPAVPSVIYECMAKVANINIPHFGIIFENTWTIDGDGVHGVYKYCLVHAVRNSGDQRRTKIEAYFANTFEVCASRLAALLGGEARDVSVSKVNEARILAPTVVENIHRYLSEEFDYALLQLPLQVGLRILAIIPTNIFSVGRDMMVMLIVCLLRSISPQSVKVLILNFMLSNLLQLVEGNCCEKPRSTSTMWRMESHARIELCGRHFAKTYNPRSTTNFRSIP